MTNMWMVRAGENSFLIEDFKNNNLVAIGWDLGDLREIPDEEIATLFEEKYGSTKSLNQVLRFKNEFQINDYVITADTKTQTFYLGKIISDYHRSDIITKQDSSNDNYFDVRDVEWICEFSKDEFSKDYLKESTQKTLGAVQTVYKINEEAAEDILKNTTDIKQIRTLTLSDTNQDSLSYDDAVKFLSDVLINERDCHYHYFTPFNLLGKTLVLFKYQGELIGKGIIMEKVSEKVIQDGDEYNGYYIVDKDSISIFKEPVGLEELNKYVNDINTLSRDQIIDLKYLNEVNKMIEDHQDPYNRIASKIRDYLDDNNLGDNNLGDLSSEETERNISYFKSKFSPEILKELNGMDVLNTIFLHDGDKNNLCYNLEFNNRYSFAGSIKGGTAFKYSLFKSNKNQQWVSGSSLNQISLTEEEAIEEGTKIRDALVQGADLIEKTDLNTINDYDILENELNKIFSNSGCSPSNSWVHKYFVLLFPEKLACMHSNQMKIDTIKKFNLEVEDGFYAQDGQFYLIAKKAGIKLYSIFDGRIERLFNLFVEEEDDGLGDSDVKTVNYWLYSPGAGAEHWEEFYNQNILAIGWDGTGDLNDFSTKEDIKLHLQEIYNDQFSHRNDVLALWQFANEIQVGDIIYAKKGMSEIIGKGIIEGEYLYDSSRDYYKHVRKIKWTDKGNWPYDSKLPMKTLTNITNYTNMVNTIKSHFESEEIIIEEEETYPPYTEEDFLDDVYISEDKYNTLKDLLSIKKNLIIQGPPGVGKIHGKASCIFNHG